jgi:hypothetical protein
VVAVSHHDIYDCRESKAHQESDSYSTTVVDNGLQHAWRQIIADCESWPASEPTPMPAR